MTEAIDGWLVWVASNPFAATLLVVCAALALCPSSWDPAIRWKERQERRHK